MGRLRCCFCDYSLRGLTPAGREGFRCPECGESFTLEMLATRLVERRRAWRRVHGEIGVAFGIAFVIALTQISLGPWTSDEIALRLSFLGRSWGVPACLGIATILGVASVFPWPSIGQGERVVFAAGATLLLALYPFPWGPGLFLAWIAAFQVRALNERFRTI